MQMKQKIKKAAVLLVAVLMAVASLNGISAYFTATDTATNTFSVGQVAIDLQEPSWEDNYPTTPNGTVAKDPQIKNIGESDAFTFLEVIVPFAEVVVADSDGSVTSVSPLSLFDLHPSQIPFYQELFEYEINDDWIEVGDKYDTEAGTATHVYAYVGDEPSTMEAVSKNETTTTLFDSVRMINIIDGQGYDGHSLEIQINAYGIETEIIGGDKSPANVWNIIFNQVKSPLEFNKYGFVFGKKYTFTESADFALSIEFFEDGSANMYENGQLVYAEPSGSLIYSKDLMKASGGDLEIPVLDGGRTIIFDGMPMTLESGNESNIELMTDAGLYKDGKMVASWNKLIATGLLEVADGVVVAFHSNHVYCGDKFVIADEYVRIYDEAFVSHKDITTITIPKSMIKINSYAFNLCDNLTTINYKGTMDEWNNVILGMNVNYKCPEITVHCTDGDVIIPVCE